MKLIIENIDGVLYAYTESKSHFQAASKSRSTRQIDPTALDNECNLSAYENGHFVFDPPARAAALPPSDVNLRESLAKRLCNPECSASRKPPTRTS